MNKDPAFLFYSSDFLTGCLDLTMEERGQYITLICLQHQKGHISEKTIRLCVGSVSVDVMKKFKKDENGLYYNERIEEEIKKRTVFIDSRRKNGRFGGRPKKPYGLPSAKPYAQPTKNLGENENENENDNIINNNFDEFWNYYTPVKSNDGHFVAKGNKKSCKEKFVKLINKGENYENIIRGLEQYLKYCQENGICSCGAEVFLNQRRWENDYSSNGTVQSNVPGRLHRQHPDIVETARQFAEMP